MNRDQEHDFFQQIREGAAWFRTRAPEEIIVIHHNDADGLSCGAILQSIFYRENHRPRRIALEKPFPEVLKKIVAGIDNPARTLLVIADFGSGMLPVIESISPRGLSVLLLDHHQLSPSSSEDLFIINPLQFGISGRTECTASSVCYLFAKNLNVWNSDHAVTALAGILGDGQFQPGFKLSGLNTHALADALENKSLHLNGEPVVVGTESYPLARIVAGLNALGAVGYFEGGSDLAVKGLLDGWGVEVDLKAQEMITRFEHMIDSLLSADQFNHESGFTWFSLGKEFERIGVKTVGLVCEELIRRQVVTGERYVLGFQAVGSFVPGVGDLSDSQIKVSMRVSPALVKAIEEGKALPLTAILPLATERIGGFVDACHPHAAATTVPAGREHALLDEIRKIIGEDRSRPRGGP